MNKLKWRITAMLLSGIKKRRTYFMRKVNRLLALLLAVMLVAGSTQMSAIAEETARSEAVTPETAANDDEIESVVSEAAETEDALETAITESSYEDKEQEAADENSTGAEITNEDSLEDTSFGEKDSSYDESDEKDSQADTVLEKTAEDSFGEIPEDSFSDNGENTLDVVEDVFENDEDSNEEYEEEIVKDQEDIAGKEPDEKDIAGEELAEEDNGAEVIVEEDTGKDDSVGEVLTEEKNVEEETIDSPPQNASEDESDYYVVTFDANGGYYPENIYTLDRWEEGSNQNRVTYKSKYGSDVVPKEIKNSDPSLHFVGWSYSENGDIDFFAHQAAGDEWLLNVDTSFLKSKNCTLYAVWSRDILETCYGASHYDGSVRMVIYANGLLSITGTGIYYPTQFKSGEDVIGTLYEIKKVVVGEGITRLYSGAFQSYNSLTDISLPDSLKSIGNNAFSGCSSLPEIVIPEGVTSIGGSAFRGCSSLTSIVLPDVVTKIQEWTFFDCNSLQTIALPKKLTSIGHLAFRNCTCLLSIEIPDGVTSIGEEAFCRCTSLKSIHIPSSVTSIGEMAFYECSSLPDVSIPDGVLSIGEMAFSKCISLQSINIPASVTEIGDDVFEGCPKELVICGTTGSVAEQYANDNNIIFRDLNKLNLDTAVVTGITAKTYTGNTITQSPIVKMGAATLKAGTDYSISYKNNINVGTATLTITGKGNYTGTITRTFKINKAAQSITVKASASSIAVGKTATVSITGARGTKSFKSSDTTIATVTSAGKVTAKKVGTVKITATSAATSNYNAASKTVTIKVVPAATASLTASNLGTGIKLTWKKVAGATGYRVYRGSTLLKVITSGSTVTFADAKANTNGTKYTFKVIATASTGISTLSKSVSYYRIARPAISSATNSAAGRATVKWGKNATATGYQIQYSLSNTFASGNKTLTLRGAATVSRVIASLTKGKTYYIRMRTYKTVGSTNYWSLWSPTKSVKINK